jgi:hypothetical protein
MNPTVAGPCPVTAGSDRSPGVIGRGDGMEQKYAVPMTGRVLAIPFN